MLTLLLMVIIGLRQNSVITSQAIGARGGGV